MSYADRWVVPQLKKLSVHQEAYTAILDSALKQGAARWLADRVGISEAYLSRVRHGKAGPVSRSLAEKIVAHIEMPPEQRQDLLKHMILAREIEVNVKRQHTKRDLVWLKWFAIPELMRVHRLASYSQTPQEALTFYRALFSLGSVLLAEFHSLGLATSAAETHILLNDVLCVLNRPGEALYHALMARAILDGDDEKHDLQYADPWGTVHLIEFPDLQVNATRIEAVCYNILGLHNKAEQLCNVIIRGPDVRRKPGIWMSHLWRDRLEAMARLPGVAVEDLASVARQAYAVHEEQNDRLGLLLIHNVLARGYLLREEYRRAEEVLVQELQVLDNNPHAGQLHKATLFSRLAAAHYGQGNHREWERYIRQAVSLACKANLAQLLGEICQENSRVPAFGKVYSEAMGETQPAETE
ncbi:MAG: hypothetical protein Kow0063_42240 [Anaerolineae bacterium]